MTISLLFERKSITIPFSSSEEEINDLPPLQGRSTTATLPPGRRVGVGL